MTQLNDSALRELLQEAIEKDRDFVKEVLKKALQEFLEMERDNQIGVGRHIRDAENRSGTRNGYKDRKLNTRMGKLNLEKPQIREYPFKTKLFENYQRSEKALLAAIQQMVIDGVSTKKVKKITKELSGELSFSKSTVSRLIKELDPMIKQWRERQLKNHYGYLISDACYFYVRENKKVVNIPMLITIGINFNGYREILGADMAVSESEETWREHHRGLKARGVETTSLTISDKLKGLVTVLQEEYSGSPHQRCMVHFKRNVLSKVPYKERKVLGEYLKQIYNSPTKEMALKIAGMISDKYRNKYPKVSKILDNHVEETLSYYDFPKHHKRKIRTTNLIEGTLNSKLKRRSKVVGIFPNRESCIRYACSILMEVDEDWQTGRRYMRMEEKESDETEEFMEEIKQTKSSKELVAQ